MMIRLKQKLGGKSKKQESAHIQCYGSGKGNLTNKEKVMKMNIDKVMNITKEKELENELDIQSWLVLMEINENRYRGK